MENHDNAFDCLELNHFIVNEHRSASSTHSLREWNEDDVDVLVNDRVSKPLLLLWGMLCHYNWFLCILFLLKFSIRLVNLCFNHDNTFLFQSNIHNLICHVPVQLSSIGRGDMSGHRKLGTETLILFLMVSWLLKLSNHDNDFYLGGKPTQVDGSR